MTRVILSLSVCFIAFFFLLPFFLPQPLAIIILPDKTIVSALLADTPALQQKGLSDRSNPIAMLFVQKEKSIPKYWMKDMRFPIDLIWIDDQTIVGILENLPPENPAMTLYSANIPIDRVLEVPAGFIKLHTLKVGDLLDITLPKR